jgi:hypothetical protein
MKVPFIGTAFALHPEWKKIAAQAWSMRFAYAGALYSGIDAALSFAVEGRIGATLVVFGITTAIAVSRIVHQPALSGAAAQQDAAE